MSLKQIKRIISNIECEKILIYNPNIEMAKNENWIHYKTTKTFIKIEEMCEIVKEAGFDIKISRPYYEDYVIFGIKNNG